MPYCTRDELEAITGYGYADFRQEDDTMTPQQWANFVTSLISGVSQQINRYCNRLNFESSEYVENHDGRGMTGERGREFRELDRTFLPREQPVISVTKVEVDIASMQEIPNWISYIGRSPTAAGQYAVSSDGYVTRIRFHDEVPRKGLKNVRITYTAGYAPGDPVLADIKLICLDLIANILAKKKREQEAAVVSWGSGTQDGANMIQMIRPEILTKDVQARLDQYKRSRRGIAWH